MRYALTRIEREAQDKAYRFYVTDCLNFIAENTANAAHGRAFKKRFAEMLTKSPIETRTSDEIIDGIKGRLAELRTDA